PGRPGGRTGPAVRRPRPPHQRPLPVGGVPELRVPGPGRGAGPRPGRRGPPGPMTTTRELPDDVLAGRPARADLAAVGPVEDWYRDAIIYELHIRAFNDSDGDGVGDLRGLIDK